MLAPEQLCTLRSEAASRLDEVQALPRFNEQLRKLNPPDAALAISFPDVRRICSDMTTRDLDPSTKKNPATDKEDPEFPAKQDKKDPSHEKKPDSEEADPDPETKPDKRFAHRLVPGAGKAEIRRDVDEDVLSALEEYRSQVERFAREYVFGAEWSARAVHDALRADRAIRLPAPPPSTYYRLAREVPLPTEELAAGALIEAGQLEALIGLFETAIMTLRAAEPVVADRSALFAARDNAREMATRSEDAQDAVRVLEAYAAPGEGDPKELGQGRAKTWEHALRRVEARLLDRKATQSERTAYKTVKTWLNAAVNGSWNARIPLEQTDAEDYFTTVLPQLEAPHRWRPDRSNPSERRAK